jgi:hypothetical protein
MPGTSKAILVGACAALAFPVTIGAAVPALVVLASATMAGVIVVRSTPAEPQQWLSVQLLMAMTVGLLGWEVHSRLGGALASILLDEAVLFAALAAINYRSQRRIDHARRRARRPPRSQR